jgi:predicted RNase H-like nuclease (RuvC/YqgF family)
LESVVESGGDFGEVKDLIARYDTLSATNTELLDRARDAQERTEKDRNSFLLSTEEKNNTLLNYNNVIAKLQTRLEESQRKSAKWQSELESTLKSATQKTLLHGQIKMTTNNLFSLVKQHLNNRLPYISDPLVQLEKIQQFAVDLQEILSSDVLAKILIEK